MTHNLFADIPQSLVEEQVSVLLAAAGVRIERIVSTGQVTPPGTWLDQDGSEWVALLAGAAGLLIEGEATARVLVPGSHVHLPAHLRHRVEWTSTAPPAVWLAVHYR
jgi:cupin 2 domain-containing protein